MKIFTQYGFSNEMCHVMTLVSQTLGRARLQLAAVGLINAQMGMQDVARCITKVTSPGHSHTWILFVSSFQPQFMALYRPQTSVCFYASYLLKNIHYSQSYIGMTEN